MSRTNPGSGPSRSKTAGLGLVAVLAVVELAWLYWFLFVPLPNVQNLGPSFRRWMILAYAFPEVVPGVRLEQSHVGRVLIALGHPAYLPQRLPVVLGAAAIGAAAIALGELGLRLLGLRRSLTRWERLPLDYLLGTSGLAVATLIIGRLGWLGPWPVRAALGVPLVLEAALRFRDRRAHAAARDDRAPPASDRVAPGALVGFALIAAPFLLLMVLGAMLPTVDYDAIEYHLQGPKEYYQAGRIAFLPHNVYTSMPFSVEMLHLLGMEVLDDWWWGALVGQLLVACFAPAAAAFIALTARSLRSPRAAWFAGLVYLTTPWVYRLAELPYVEGPLCAYHAALIWACARLWVAPEQDLRIRLWGLAGVLAGGAMACKYPALISAVLPVGLLALFDAARRRSGLPVLAYAAGWGVIMTPWLAKNVIDTGNPVYPLAYQVFGGRDWDDAREAQWVGAHGPRPITAAALRDGILDVAGRSDWHSPLYTALAPLALLQRPGRRAAWALWGYVAYLFLTWWLLTHRLDRFWLPLLPPLAILAGLGADWTRRWAWLILLGTIFAFATVLNFTFITTALAGLNEWTEDLRVLRTKVPAMTNPPLARLDRELGPGDKVLLVGQAAVFHLNHAVVYNTVFNREIFETLARGRTAAEIARALHERGITHIYVDWFEIERYRSPGNYGFTPFVTPAVFARLVDAGVLEPAVAIAQRQELYRVR